MASPSNSSSEKKGPKYSARRQPNRVKKQPARQPACLLTPRASPSPANSRPSTPVRIVDQNRRVSTPLRAGYVSSTPGSPNSSNNPVVNWDCVSYVVSEQKINSTYEKPKHTPGTTHVTAYGRVVTTTTTTTVTTTVATTEILNPNEEGYEASLARQQTQTNASPQDRELLEKKVEDGRALSMGHNKVPHECFHQSHHRSAKPARAIFTAA